MRKNRNRARQQAEDHRKHPEDETDGKTGNQKKSEYRKLQSDPDLYCALPGDIQCIVPWQRKAGGCTFTQKRRFGAGILPRGCSGKDIDPQDVQAFLQLADQALLKGDKDSLMPYLQSASGTYCTDVPMNAGQELRVELALDWEQKTYQVLSWKVYHQEDYEIDQSIPVWSGN